MIRFITSLALALVVLVALTVSLSTPAQTADNPINLELGGEGATSWDITGIMPGDTGTKTVTLHNAGDVDGFVTIWISDVVSSEGINPESETGDTAEPGELDDHLLFNISCSRLSTNIGLPTTIDNLPQTTYPSPGYLRVTPLDVGDTVTLAWQWELPALTGNDVQGDMLSFTINYMLEEIGLRGDADGDGDVDIFDAMYIAQYLVGERSLEDLNYYNAASVKHDDPEDIIDIFDAMYIAQYLVGLRDSNFEWIE